MSDGATVSSIPEPPGVSEDTLQRLLQRLEHVEAVATRLERLADQVPGLAATAADVFDESARNAAARGIDFEERLARLTQLLERLTADDTFPALLTLVDRVDRLEALTVRLDEVPGLIAIVTDVADEWARKLVAEGVDLDRAAAQGLRAALWLGERITEHELNRLGILLRSDVLEPHALAAVGKMGRALASCHEQQDADQGIPEQVGPVGLLRALNDPDIQRGLGFALRVAQAFGRSLPHPHDAVS